MGTTSVERGMKVGSMGGEGTGDGDQPHELPKTASLLQTDRGVQARLLSPLKPCLSM